MKNKLDSLLNEVDRAKTLMLEEANATLQALQSARSVKDQKMLKNAHLLNLIRWRDRIVDMAFNAGKEEASSRFVVTAQTAKHQIRHKDTIYTELQPLEDVYISLSDKGGK